MADKLTLKQERFIAAYLGEAHGNATDAARLAGYAGSDATLCVAGSENLRNPNIAARIKATLDAEAMPAHEVLRELADIGRAPWRDFLKVRRDIMGNEIDARLDLRDKVKALELLGKHHKLFTDRTEISGHNGGPISIIEVVAPDGYSDLDTPDDPPALPEDT